MKTEYDVVIAGAGPVGLFLACELALARRSVLIIERSADVHAPVNQIPFGIRGLSAPTIEALDRRGLFDELEVPRRTKNPHQNATAGPRRQVGHFAGLAIAEGNVDRARWSDRPTTALDPSAISEMDELITVLGRRALALGVVIVRGAAVSGFNASDAGVTVHAGEREFAAKWLVGCDGARSVVRKTAGFDFVGTEPEFTGYSTHVELGNADGLRPGRVMTEGGMYMQSQPGYVVMADFDGGRGHRPEFPTRERVQEVLRRLSGTDVTVEKLHLATTWTDRARQASAYRHGRVLLAGDAAHIHSPLGGQGLNLGLGDAMNLGWKLAAVIEGRAPQGLLESYARERHPIGARVLEWSRAQVALMRPDPGARAMRAIFAELIDTRDGATYVAERIWGLRTDYDLGDGHPLIGRSVPNHEIEGGATVNVAMRDGRALLVERGGSRLRSLAEEFAPHVGHAILREGDARAPFAVLARPDGYVVWATDDVTDDAAARAAIEGQIITRGPGGR